MKRFCSLVMAITLTLGMILPVSAADTAVCYGFGDKITQWKAVNSDVEGWLYIEGTNISYPVIFYPHDSLYYESRGYDKKYSKNGVIYAERLTKSGMLSEMSLNTILFGHNWTNVSATPRIGSDKDIMFAQLPAFTNLDFISENQFINYANSDGSYVFQVFAAFYTEASFVYYDPNPTREEFDQVMSSVQARNLFNIPVGIGYGDHYITLSTCTRAFGSSKDQRFVVMAKMVPSGTEKVAITARSSYQKPRL